MVNKLLKAFAAVVMLSVLILISFDQSRSFYILSDKQHLTVWKRLGNECIIVPEKYYGIIKPKYCIQTTNDNALTIIYGKLMVYDYIICNDYGKPINISLKNKNIKYYDYPEKDKFINEYFDSRIRDNLQYIQMDIKENLIIINGEKK